MLEHASEVCGRLEYDFEFLLLLRTYREERKTFLDGTAGRELIDQALRDYCLSSEDAADLAVLKCQLALAAEPARLREAFPTTGLNFPAWWTLWSWITADVADRLAEPATDLDPDALFEQLRKVLRRCEQTTDKTWLGLGWGFVDWVYIGTIGGLVALLGIPAVIATYYLLRFAVLIPFNIQSGSAICLMRLGPIG